MGFYVDVSDVPLDFLEFMGYRVEKEDGSFILLNHKGEQHIVSKNGARYLMVDDYNDAKIFDGRRKIEVPPCE